jgi:hypothetical protein
MTTVCLPDCAASFVPAKTGRIGGSVTSCAYGAFRLPTDALFYASLTLQNVAQDSRYRVTRHDTGDQLDSGVQSGDRTDIVISGLAAYSNPMLMDVSVRKASASPLYKPVATSAYLYKTGGSSYIVQVSDE